MLFNWMPRSAPSIVKPLRIRAVGHQAAGGDRRRDDARHRVDRGDQSIDHAGICSRAYPLVSGSIAAVITRSGLNPGSMLREVRQRAPKQYGGKDHRERQRELRDDERTHALHCGVGARRRWLIEMPLRLAGARRRAAPAQGRTPARTTIERTAVKIHTRASSANTGGSSPVRPKTDRARKSLVHYAASTLSCAASRRQQRDSRPDAA